MQHVQFLYILIHHFENYLHTLKLKFTKHVGSTTFLLYNQTKTKQKKKQEQKTKKQKQKKKKKTNKQKSEILIFKTFIAKFWIFPIFRKKVRHVFLWRHNYVTHWPIVLILVCLTREDPYLSTDTKTNFIEGSVRKI